jgi:hypothetical protein
MVALGIESGGEREHVGRTKLHTEATGFAVLDDDGNATFCHGNSPLEVVRTLHKTVGDYARRGAELDVTNITDVCERRTVQRPHPEQADFVLRAQSVVFLVTAKAEGPD